MKKIISILVLVLACGVSNGQTKSNGFNRIVLNTYLPANISIPKEAKKMLEDKLTQIATHYGVGGNSINPRFVITANVNVGTKDFISGPPQMLAQNLEITISIGDAYTAMRFSDITIKTKGVGTNEDKAFIDAIINLNNQSKEIAVLMEEGKNKIISYFNSQCEFIIKEAEGLAKQEKYDAAIYTLVLIPDVCKECYIKAAKKLPAVYKSKIDFDCKQKLQEAKNKWAASPNQETALLIEENLSSISPSSSCFNEVRAFSEKILKKTTVDEREKKLLAQKNHVEELSLEKEQIIAYENIAVAYFNRQPGTKVYNNIYWK
ncbi:hypothetical protein CJD36_020210 [Flavipsychrobacter stenotrophus]|uniref:Uncharacterized protein n=1 Tax=Flavipsychrobacter stenotrophus TaxID=2077091 RepID=A0A2S7SQV0_9BACT|nr:hypothetical protein [Flavipsychrobacter stenotrophus]PQJ09124.1 hypothetical protein CJD36_020210 [Flavipsychrobacter stenotrophus]